MTKIPAIINNLEKARRLAFPDFDRITLEPGAVRVLVNLFLHPGCKSDVNLAKFLTGLPVALSAISSHIITAFPSQIASYANERGLTRITSSHVLECFALDHADAVEENQTLLGFEPSYALAHVLTIGTVARKRQGESRQLVDITVTVCGEAVTFSHVLVPTDMPVAVDQLVFHHFGVIVSAVVSPALRRLANRLQRDQDKKKFIQRTIKQVHGAAVSEIDYAKAAFFRVDMAGQIIKESKKDVDFFRLWQEEDLRKIKFPKQAKVMFQS